MMLQSMWNTHQQKSACVHSPGQAQVNPTQNLCATAATTDNLHRVGKKNLLVARHNRAIESIEKKYL